MPVWRKKETCYGALFNVSSPVLDALFFAISFIPHSSLGRQLEFHRFIAVVCMATRGWVHRREYTGNARAGIWSPGPSGSKVCVLDSTTGLPNEWGGNEWMNEHGSLLAVVKCSCLRRMYVESWAGRETVFHLNSIWYIYVVLNTLLCHG